MWICGHIFWEGKARGGRPGEKRAGQERDWAMEVQDEGGKGKMDAWNPMGARERK